MAFSGAFVFIEPSPYEVVGLLTIFVFALTGLSVPRALTPLLLLLVLLNIGYAMAVLQVIDQPKPVIWVGVSAYLAVTAVFYAAVLATNTEQRLDLIMRGYVAAAVIASLVGIGAYFHAFGGRLRHVPALQSRPRHLQRPQRAQRLRDTARTARIPARARRPPLRDGARQRGAAHPHGRSAAVVLARGLGPVRPVRGPADVAHLHHQPLRRSSGFASSR